MRLPARIRPSDHDLKPVCSVARRGIWENLFRELAGNGRSVDMQMIDSTHVKPTAPRPAEKGRKSRLLAVRAEGATRRSMHSQMLKDALSPSC